MSSVHKDAHLRATCSRGEAQLLVLGMFLLSEMHKPRFSGAGSPGTQAAVVHQLRKQPDVTPLLKGLSPLTRAAGMNTAILPWEEVLTDAQDVRLMTTGSNDGSANSPNTLNRRE